LSDAYDEEKVADKGNDDDYRTVLRFHPNLAPITVAVLPLMKKDGLAEIAKAIQKELNEEYNADYDQSGAIGRRYRRQDEAGTPFCITVDYETKEQNTVTLRFRDSMEQVRVPVAELRNRIRKEIADYKRVK
jgi:glycyl-tRNA synthetase